MLWVAIPRMCWAYLEMDSAFKNPVAFQDFFADDAAPDQAVDDEFDEMLGELGDAAPSAEFIPNQVAAELRDRVCNQIYDVCRW